MKTEFHEANILSATTDIKKYYDINIIYKTDDGFIINQHFCPAHFNKAYFRVSDNTFTEKDIQNALNDGVVHYPTTALPGQKGNVVIVGHSSNNLFNPGKYKYAFVMLNKLQAGDTFMLNYSGQRYVYKVYQTQIVKPSDTWVLDPQPGKDSIATLITCDPPGTNINRMVVFGEQILPTPDKNTTVATTAKPSSTTKTSVPGNSPSLINRILGIN